MPESFAFYPLAIIASTSALYVVLTKRLTYGVLSLVITMFSLSALFALRGAYFVSVIQILIYAGAILVLFLFILMLIGMEGAPENLGQSSPFRILAIGLMGCLFLGELVIIMTATNHSIQKPSGILGAVENIGRALFTNHLLSFELVSLILLVGVIGVVTISRKEN